MRVCGRIALAAALACAIGCAAGPAPIDHYYRIDVAAPPAGGEPLVGAIHVDRMRADGLSGERSLLYRSDGSSPEVHRLAYHLWTDPPALAVQTQLVAYLQRAGVANVVMPANARTRPDWQVGGRIGHFERWAGPEPQVVVELDLDVTDGDGAVIVNATYRETRVVSSDDAAQMASAIDDALGAIFARFVADLRATR